MDNILFESEKFKLTRTNFTYQGHKEEIENILSLNVIEWSQKDRIKYGMGLGIFSIIMFYTIGWFLILPVLGALSEDFSSYFVEATTSIVFIFFSVLGYLSRKGYTLELERSNGNKGTIGKSIKRSDFDPLLLAFMQAKASK